jgi:hypothetical protein
MKRVADEQEPIVAVQLVLDPVVVEDAVAIVLVQHRHVPVVVVVERGRTSMFAWEAILITADRANLSAVSYSGS